MLKTCVYRTARRWLNYTATVLFAKLNIEELFSFPCPRMPQSSND